MPKQYQLSLKTPHGNCQVEADGYEELLSLVPAYMVSVGRAQAAPDPDPESELTRQAKALLRKYTNRHGRQESGRRGSPIAVGGAELDLVKCFLRGTSAKEAADFLYRHNQIKTSRTAVGRYWARLWAITPNKRPH